MTAVPGDLLDRARGAWFGQLTGDALGTTVEFQPPSVIAARHPAGLRQIVGGGPFGVLPGQVTDDGELALALARSLVEHGRYVPDAVASAYLAWFASGPFDCGETIGAAFGGGAAPGRGAAAAVARLASAGSEANGALMRVSPLAIHGHALAAGDLAELAAFDARLSHAHPLCQAANVVFAHAIATAVRDGTDAATTFARTVEFARSRPSCAIVVPLLLDAARQPPDDFVATMGWVRIALQNAFHELLHAPSFEAGVVATVMRGGDTDTNACIAGALLGAVHGEGAVPLHWRDTVVACRTDRGATFQTGDARELAAALVAAGRTVR